MEPTWRFRARVLAAIGAVWVVATIAGLAAFLVSRGSFGLPRGVSVVVAVLASLLLAGAVSWMIAKRIAHPIEELADAGDAAASGAYSARLPDSTFSVELQRLGDAFSRMSARLSDTEASRTRLLSDLAHEIRTPLATLEAYIDGLEDGVVSADGSAWSTMRDQVSRLRRLTTDLRETAAAEEHALHLQLEQTLLADVVVAAVEAVIPRSRAKGVDVITAGMNQQVPVRVDADRIKQVLANLLDNALRHTPPGGNIIVTLDVDEHSAMIDVSDDGDGIPPEQIEMIFARFHRVDASRRATDGSGSGLGLTIARAIVTDHGGSISARSDGPGTGSTFTIRLPRSR